MNYLKLRMYMMVFETRTLLIDLCPIIRDIFLFLSIGQEKYLQNLIINGNISYFLISVVAYLCWRSFAFTFSYYTNIRDILRRCSGEPYRNCRPLAYTRSFGWRHGLAVLSVPKFTANLYCICLSINLRYT